MLAKKCLFVGIVTLLSLSLAIAAPPAVHPTTGEPLVITCLRGTPNAIDGDLSDWNLEAMTPAVVNVVEQLFSGQTAWTGPDDCSGEFYLMWDDVNIYIAVVVKDEKLSMNKTNGDIWNADCVEVFFSTTNAVAGHAEHYQYGFNANNQKWNWCNIDGASNRAPDYLQIVSSPTAGGYTCEVSIPYAQMPSLNFSVGNAVGFHPVFDDTDNGDRELQMTWTGREAHDQSLGFGQLILSDEPAVPGPVPVDPGAEGLVAYYALDADANDSSGNGFNGTLLGDPEFVEGPPGYGMAMYFDGDDYVDTGNAQNLANWTISAWVKSPAAPVAIPGTNLTSGPVHREKNFQLNWNHTNATFRGAAAFRVGGTWHAAKYEPVEADTWYHLTATYDGEDLKAYRDGVLITTNSAPSGPSDAETGTLKLGRHATSATQYFTGTVDEATIYSRALSEGEILFLAGQRLYSYDGDAAVSGPANSNDSLDGTWDHNNGSDAWDGSGIAQAAPGGASALVEDGVTFLRIQDPGDPRDYGMPDPSNRKVYFTHTTDVGLDGVRLEVRARIATTAPIDDQHPDGGAGIKPWPAEGIGSHIRDDGKGMFGIAQEGLGIISFSLAQPGESGFENVATDVLVMNNLVGAAPSGDVDTGVAAAKAVNMLAVDDATQWNTFVIDIVAGGTGTHVVSVSANGKPAQSFDVTVGTGLEAGKGSYITLGSSGTGPLTAFDIDYISVSRPIPATEPQEPEIVNLLANGGFEDGVLEPWNTYGAATAEVVRQLAGAVVPEGPIEGSHSLHVTVPAAGANFWDMGLQHAGHVFEANKEYTLSVWLKCKSGTLQINLKPELAASPWSGFGEQQVTITDKWAQYSLKTPVFGQDTSPGSITFHIGFAAAEFWVDGAQFYESAYFPPVEPPPGGVVNELTNGNFEEGPSMPLDTWAPLTWNVYGTHTMEVVSELTGAAVPQAPIEGTYCLHVTVPQASANFWDVGLQHIGHTFKQGKKYTLSVWLKSKSGTLNINMKPELGANPWSGFGERQITITDQWTEYSTTTPVFGQDTNPGTITFHIGFAVGDFWVDNVRWYEGDYVAP